MRLIQEVRARLPTTICNGPMACLYPVLHRMENNGWIKSRWVKMENGPEAQILFAQKDGKDALDEQRTQWLKVHGVLTQVWERERNSMSELEEKIDAWRGQLIAGGT